MACQTISWLGNQFRDLVFTSSARSCSVIFVGETWCSGLICPTQLSAKSESCQTVRVLRSRRICKLNTVLSYVCSGVSAVDYFVQTLTVKRKKADARCDRASVNVRNRMRGRNKNSLVKSSLIEKGNFSTSSISCK